MKKSKLSNRPQNKNFGTRAGRKYGKHILKNNIEKYIKNPKYCKQCSKHIPYEKRKNVFCSKSCSASFNNIKSPKRKKENYGSCPVTFKYCKTCKLPFRVLYSRQKFCNHKCNNTKTPTSYRRQCKFKLNKIEHKELFDSHLISKYGWYNPTNKPGETNLNGVCWDHLLRIEDGFKQNIDPKILKHPANAELVPWKDNIKRSKSTITIDELHERIKQWDAGNRDLKKFYKK